MEFERLFIHVRGLDFFSFLSLFFRMRFSTCNGRAFGYRLTFLYGKRGVVFRSRFRRGCHDSLGSRTPPSTTARDLTVLHCSVTESNISSYVILCITRLCGFCSGLLLHWDSCRPMSSTCESTPFAVFTKDIKINKQKTKKTFISFSNRTPVFLKFYPKNRQVRYT